MSDCGKGTEEYPSDCEILEGYRARVRDRQSQETSEEWKRAIARAANVKLLLLDVDGVLTDGHLYYSNGGEETKTFNTQDGFGLRVLQDNGIDVGVITARKSEIVARRGNELKMRYLYQGAPNKLTAFQEISKKSGLKPFEIAYMGDDWLDLVLLNRVGLALAPANAVAEVKDVAHYITNQDGGAGAVREVCDLILKSKGLFEISLQKYMNPTP